MEHALNQQTAELPVRPRYRRRLAVAALVLLSGWAFRDSLLHGLAAGLIVDDRTQGAQSSEPALANTILILDGDRKFDAAAEMYRCGATRILVYHAPPERLEQMGIRPTADETSRRELSARGIPSHHLEILVGDSDNRSTVAAALGQWLAEHPGQRVSVLCDRFTSRTWKSVLQRTVEPVLIGQISVVPLTNRQFDETNWWRSKSGTMAILCGYIRLSFHAWRSAKELVRVERTRAEFQAPFAGDSH